MKPHRSSGPRVRRDADTDLAAWLERLSLVPVAKTAPSPEQVAARLRELSRGFTRERALAGRHYLDDPFSLAAYLGYFWPVSYVQTRRVFERLLYQHSLKGASVLDLGSGPAPGGFAALDCGAARVLAVDPRRGGTTIARELARLAQAPLSVGHWDANAAEWKIAGRFDVILLGHVLNELWPGHLDRTRLRSNLVERAAGYLRENGLVILIEPALLAVTRDLLAVRDELVRRGFFVTSPCFRQETCPCLDLPDATCHADYAWQAPAAVTRLAHRARLGKPSLPFSCVVLSRTRPTVKKKLYRVVSEKMLSKSGRLRHFICGADGRWPLSAKPEGREPWAETFRSLERYDVIEIAGTRPRENGQGLERESVCKKLN